MASEQKLGKTSDEVELLARHFDNFKKDSKVNGALLK
jgi:hypothetical protein